jgi:hypothetical protein
MDFQGERSVDMGLPAIKGEVGPVANMLDASDEGPGRVGLSHSLLDGKIEETVVQVAQGVCLAIV